MRATPQGAPAGTAAGPDGLRATTGYASYELCQSGCTGAVPASLRRPLRISSAGACPVSPSHRIAGVSALGSAPAGPAQPATLGVSAFIGSSWSAARVTWVAASSYAGPVLIRGRRIDAGGAVGFGEGHVPYDELQLSKPVSTSAGAREWPSFTRVRAAGCYAYQVDGTSFSAVIVFRAR